MRVGLFPGDELGVGKPEATRPPVPVILRQIVDDVFSRPVADAFPFNVGVQTKGTVIRTTPLRLHADTFADVFAVLRKNRGKIGKIDRQRIQQGRRMFRSLCDAAAFFDDKPFVAQGIPIQDFQNGILPFA